MGRGLRELTVNLRNMIFMQRIKGASVLNAGEALGIVPGNGGGAMKIDQILALWGKDLVHPTPATYRRLANKITDKVEALLSMQAASDLAMGGDALNGRLTSAESGSPVPSPRNMHRLWSWTAQQ
jgi:hypothetical protein